MTATTTSSQPLTVLLVEDDDIDAMAVTRMFRKVPGEIPITVQRAVNGADGLAQLRQLVSDRAGPLMVLLDINMPLLNGHEFLSAVRADKALESTIVFILTTSIDPKDVENAYRSHVAGYLPKTANPKAGAKVGQLLREYADAVLFPMPRAIQ
ncbi:Response regulator rcp1 [Planctomycetes bacterium Poly30]|uniref:Response regulator rcp1 n=1 Tax=Saltatorellus ferox TaxID=2528018 RepID=A0A518EZ26_9BACT|nr:Response regulator rcp1 [Planctomycetes bacterium Poly30]